MNSRISHTQGSHSYTLQGIILPHENTVYEPQTLYQQYGIASTCMPMVVPYSQSTPGTVFNYYQVYNINEPLNFYYNDIHIYCKEVEVLLTDETIECLNIDIHNPIQYSSNFYKFYYIQPVTLNFYEVFCTIYNDENPEREFSKKNQESIEFCLNNYLGPIKQGESSNGSESLQSKTTKNVPCKWDVLTIQSLLTYLEANEKEVRKLRFRGRKVKEVKKKLWKGASDYLRCKYHNKQCEI
ncbi:13556_t:CDS:2 [Funneliformis mosseae]|uniref:13556_t:CDS:1 n=1 Tax=Funneliformis mosseae TaxID=27381 RepID=A0A9N9DSY0_FUNMO|nr:13556_t:CDS:2 [Funneliformis mosseae]